MQGVLTPVIAFWVFRSPGGLPSPIFESVTSDLTLLSKWGYNNINFSNLTSKVLIGELPCFFFLYGIENTNNFQGHASINFIRLVVFFHKVNSCMCMHTLKWHKILHLCCPHAWVDKAIFSKTHVVLSNLALCQWELVWMSRGLSIKFLHGLKYCRKCTSWWGFNVH